MKVSYNKIVQFVRSLDLLDISLASTSTTPTSTATKDSANMYLIKDIEVVKACFIRSVCFGPHSNLVGNTDDIGDTGGIGEDASEGPHSLETSRGRSCRVNVVCFGEQIWYREATQSGTDRDNKDI